MARTSPVSSQQLVDFAIFHEQGMFSSSFLHINIFYNSLPYVEQNMRVQHRVVSTENTRKDNVNNGSSPSKQTPGSPRRASFPPKFPLRSHQSKSIFENFLWRRSLFTNQVWANFSYMMSSTTRPIPAVYSCHFKPMRNNIGSDNRWQYSGLFPRHKLPIDK